MKPSIPKGTRDFSPIETRRRYYIFIIIREVFEKYGYQPIETPALENLSTLAGKYGEEGDRLIFKIINSGDYLKEVREKNISLENPVAVTPYISEKALRYDLTVPFARYVVMHKNEIHFPFKRYQIQPVWRADRPQKSRYREFYQCDADVVGSPSLLNEVELIQMYDEVFTKLKLKNIEVKLNNRKILAGLAEVLNIPEKIVDFTIALDKLDKIGVDKVIEELQSKNIPQDAIDQIKPFLSYSFDNNTDTLNFLKELLQDSEVGKKGVEELEEIIGYFTKKQEKQLPLLRLKTAKLKIDITLARGLNYYTGAIMEVVCKDVAIGSLGGGGRYDDLTGIFGMPNLSGVGISFGADRIYDVLLDRNLFDESELITTEVLFTNLGEKEQVYALSLVQELRELGINVELYPDCGVKLKKQLDYANNKKIPKVIIIGEEEMKNYKIVLKNMITGEQESVLFSDVLANYKIEAY